MRALILLLLAAFSGGCANTWDTLTSRKFRANPAKAIFSSEDPLTVMKTSTEGDERAHAMSRLKEPVRHGGTSGDQDDAIRLLGEAAARDPSPVVRVAAIDALGRFQDERAAGLLVAAFNAGDGVPEGVEKPKRKARPLDPDDPMLLAERYSLRGPVGFPEEVASAIRSRAITAMAGTQRPEVLPVLAQTARGENSPDRDTQLAAVRGLSKLRSPEAVAVLIDVMKAEKGKDPALTTRAHESLKNLTGKDYPADPAQWQTALQSGTATIAPEPSAIQQVGAWFSR